MPEKKSRTDITFRSVTIYIAAVEEENMAAMYT
jgi:hypothetical protein